MCGIRCTNRTKDERTGIVRKGMIQRFLAAATVLLVLLVLAVSVPTRAGASPLWSPATTTADLNLRAGLGTGYQVLAVMPAGSRVDALLDEAHGDFVRVRYGGMEGWAAAAYLAVGNGSDDPGGEQPAAATVTDDLNLREGPGPQYRVVLVIPAGSTVTVTDEGENGYVPVAYQGTYGWVSEYYLVRGDLVA